MGCGPGPGVAPIPGRNGSGPHWRNGPLYPGCLFWNRDLKRLVGLHPGDGNYNNRDIIFGVHMTRHGVTPAQKGDDFLLIYIIKLSMIIAALGITRWCGVW